MEDGLAEKKLETLKLDSYQQEAVDYAVANPYSILALDMGLGKTPIALKIWERLKGKALIVCPAYMVLTWRIEIEKWLGKEVVVDLIRKGDDIYYLFDTDICVVSYALVQKAPHLFEWADMIFADEGHELKTMTAKRTEFFHKHLYENSIKRFHILTGTPIKNRVSEYYSMMAMMHYDPRLKDPEFLKLFPDAVTFADHFSIREEYTAEINTKRGKRWVKIVKWKGVRHADELKSFLKGHYIRFDHSILGRAKPRHKDVLISESPDLSLMSEYRSFSGHYENEEEHSTGATKKAEAALRKVPFTVQYVKGILDEIECVPIYTDHVASCKAIAEAFGAPAIHSGVSMDRRMQARDDFQNGKINVIVATVGSFSTGISLTRANNLVFNDFPWVPGDIDQVIHRIDRRPQTRPCTIHNILGSPQDAAILEEVRLKREDIKRVV